MPREKEGFRDQLETIIAAFPNKECLTITDVAEFTGIYRGRIPRTFTFNGGGGKGCYITRTQLARQMCS
ncbi:MAG: hypothetical protein RR754_07860 [Oscillospiraceae bacterium]